MKAVACIFIVLSGLFTVQPLVMMMSVRETDTCEAVNTCRKACGESKPEQKAENKNCDTTTTRCNTSSCCFASQYLPVEETLYKNFWSTSNSKINPHYIENPVSGYSSDCWQPPEVLFV